MEAEDIVGIHYRAMASEGVEDLACAIVRGESVVHELVRALYLLVVMIYKCPINSITSPNPVYSQ
jgi:hypothetical protein